MLLAAAFPGSLFALIVTGIPEGYLKITSFKFFGIMQKDPFSVLRILTSLIFIYAGGNHLLQSEKIAGKLSKTSVYQMMPNEGLFNASVLLSGIVMLVGGLALLFGYGKKLAAIVLLLMLIPITAAVQLENLNDLGPFFKNVAIAGSLIFIINYKSNEIKTPLIPVSSHTH